MTTRSGVEPSAGLRLRVVPVTPLQQNCSLLVVGEAGGETGRAVVVDPGGEVERILAVCESESARLEAILVTHGHVDHCGGVAELVRRTGLPVYGPHRDDGFWIEALDRQAEMFGLESSGAFTPDHWLEHGQTLRIAGLDIEVLHCPGHTPGHVVFFVPSARLALVGDVLFKGSIGRTDFPLGDHARLIASIRERLFPLGDDVRFVPGHGPMSTLGEERRDNPYVAP